MMNSTDTTTRLGWLNAWCLTNSKYEEWRNYTGNRTLPLGHGIQEKEWIYACVESLEPGWVGMIREGGRRFREMKSGQRAVLLAMAGFNIGTLGFMLVAIATFVEMDRQKLSWSPLVLSKLMMDNVLVFMGFQALTCLWLYSFILGYGNSVCLDGMFSSLAVASVTSLMGLSVYLTGQVLVLAIVLDRIQGLSNPVAYKFHNRFRRCLIVNGLAFASGFVPTFALQTTRAWNVYESRWNAWKNASRIREPPQSWQDTVCYRRHELALQCGWPNYATAVDEANGEILSSSTLPRYWYLRRSGPAALCPFQFQLTADGYFSAMVIFGLTFIVGVAVTVAGSKLLILFRHQMAKKVRVIYANKAAQDAADAAERHEKAVTITIVVESINVVVATAINVINCIHAIYKGLTASPTEYASVSVSAVMRTMGIICAQLAFGSYPITYIVFRSFRQTLLSLPWLAWTPKPRAVTTLLFLYFLIFCFPISFAILFA